MLGPACFLGSNLLYDAAGTPLIEAEDGTIIREVAEALDGAEGATALTTRGGSMRTMGTMMGATATALGPAQVAATTEGAQAGSSSREAGPIGATQAGEVFSAQGLLLILCSL